MTYKNLSIVIPCLNESSQIVTTLNKLQNLRQCGHEIILIDGGSTDDTIDLAKNLVDICIISAPGRARQMNQGAKAASGDILCFLHADTISPDSIDKKILNTLNTNKTIWGFFNIKLSGNQWQFRAIEWFINKRSCLSNVATGDQGIFVCRETFNELSGFSDIPLMEDIELTKRLKKIKTPACIKNHPLITSSRRWEKHGIIRTVLLMWQLRLRYFLGTPAKTLANAYVTHNKSRAHKSAPHMTDITNKQLIIFIKAPVPGQCKTRLIPYLDAELACEFYKELVNTCFKNITPLSNVDIAIYTTPDINNNFIQNLANTHPASLHIQQGNDLGERMHDAIHTSLKNHDKCVLIGTDCPVLDKPYIDNAFKALDQHDMVLGPAKDGGYVLIGATKINTRLFDNINWGTRLVLEQSLKNNETAGYSTHLLNTLWDIDEPEDYIKYQNLLNTSKYRNEA